MRRRARPRRARAQRRPPPPPGCVPKRRRHVGRAQAARAPRVRWRQRAPVGQAPAERAAAGEGRSNTRAACDAGAQTDGRAKAQARRGAQRGADAPGVPCRRAKIHGKRGAASGSRVAPVAGLDVDAACCEGVAAGGVFLNFAVSCKFSRAQLYQRACFQSKALPINTYLLTSLK